MPAYFIQGLSISRLHIATSISMGYLHKLKKSLYSERKSHIAIEWWNKTPDWFSVKGEKTFFSTWTLFSYLHLSNWKVVSSIFVIVPVESEGLPTFYISAPSGLFSMHSERGKIIFTESDFFTLCNLIYIGGEITSCG